MASTQAISPDGGLRLDVQNDILSLFVQDYHVVLWSIALTEGTSYGSGVVTLERSLDGVHWFAMDPAETLSADGIGNLHDVRGAAWVRARVSTTGTSGARVRTALVAWTE
jgi:hypothetical protein